MILQNKKHPTFRRKERNWKLLKKELWCQPGLQNESQDSQGYTEKPCIGFLEKQTNRKRKKELWSEVGRDRNTETERHTSSVCPAVLQRWCKERTR